MAMKDENASTDENARTGYPENEVVKDAAYFDELRRAVKGTPLIALFGTSGLAVYKSIDSAQDLELRKQVESVTDSNSRKRLYKVSSRYHFLITALRYVTGAVPWLSVFLILDYVTNSFHYPPASTTRRIELTAAVLAISIVIFTLAKVAQVILWRLGSFTIRYLNGMYTGRRALSKTSEVNHRDTAELD